MLTLPVGQELLQTFNSKMVPYFPFVVVPSDTIVLDLMQEKPCLCLAILSAASFSDVKLQRGLGELVNEYVAFRLAKGSLESLDLLQGLLVHLAWYDLSFCT